MYQTLILQYIQFILSQIIHLLFIYFVAYESTFYTVLILRNASNVFYQKIYRIVYRSKIYSIFVISQMFIFIYGRSYEFFNIIHTYIIYKNGRRRKSDAIILCIFASQSRYVTRSNIFANKRYQVK